MRVIVLGSGAGGGVPQWNSGGSACRLARAGDARSPARTQTGIAVSGDGASWWLLDAAPDLRVQLAATPALHPRRDRPNGGLRDSPIRGVIVTGADVDKIAGLLTLREGQPLVLWATRTVLGLLDENRIFEVLDRDRVARRALPLEELVRLEGGLRLTAFAVPGKAPRWAEDPADPLSGSPEHAVALAIEDERGGRLVYAPGCAAITDDLARRIDGASVLLLDGTLWSDDEMIRLGASTKTGRRMGHVAMSGPDGALARLRQVQVGRRLFVHLNNTNPALLEGSPERAGVAAAGWEIAHDGMELEA